MAVNNSPGRKRLRKLISETYNLLTMPLAAFFLTYSNRVRPEYKMNWPRRIGLSMRFWWNNYRVTSGTSWRAHTAMAMKLLETPKKKKGVVVECGCWKGAATVNLSLVCAIVGRELQVYDSFEGLPPPKTGDPIAEASFKNGFVAGVFSGSIDEVRRNVDRFGAIEVCKFYKGWFEDTLPAHEDDIVLAFWDVDFFASLHDCLINLWPYVVDGGYVFLDEYGELAYCSVFYSEKYWSKYFSSPPPGLIGIGTGLQVGMFVTEPIKMGRPSIQRPQSTAYTVKGTRALWEYYPDEMK